MNEILKPEETRLTETEISAYIGESIKQVLTPVLESMALFMTQNTEALERLAMSQKIQADRMEELEKQVRLNTLVTPTQVRYFNDGIKARAWEILLKKELDTDRRAVNKLSAAIRKGITARYGVSALHEIPKHEYSVVLEQIATWNNVLVVRDIMREAKKRNKAEVESNVLNDEQRTAAGID